MLKDPQPGSPEAIEAGCCCPVLGENGEGTQLISPEEFNVGNIQLSYWMTIECPVHGANDFGEKMGA